MASCNNLKTTGMFCLIVLVPIGCDSSNHSDTAAAPRIKQPNEVLQAVSEPPTIEYNGITLIRIPAGEFLMGATRVDPADPYSVGEVPAHRVRISNNFYLGQCEVTVGQFRKFVGSTGYKTEVEQNGRGANSLDLNSGDIQQLPVTVWHSPGFMQSEDHPVVCVSWNDAVAFCEWLSVDSGYTFRLPTEAEWEYACRAGQQTKFSTGDDPYSLEGFTNMADQTLLAVFPLAGGTAPWYDGTAYSCKIGSFNANQFGLHDMHGNVGEWCHDWYSPDYYQQSPDADPTGPAEPSEMHPWHAVRGGSWFNSAHSCRASGRHDAIETAPSTTNGFRVLREVSR